MPRYFIQPVAGYWAIINRDTGETFVEVLDRKQVERVMKLLDKNGEVERPVVGEQLQLFPSHANHLPETHRDGI